VLVCRSWQNCSKSVPHCLNFEQFLVLLISYEGLYLFKEKHLLENDVTVSARNSKDFLLLSIDAPVTQFRKFLLLAQLMQYEKTRSIWMLSSH
jgi:hypothetical protein